MGVSPGWDWARWLAQARPNSLQGDHEQACAAEEREGAPATAGLADHPTPLILGEEVHLDLCSAPLVEGLLAAPFHTRLLMTSPMQVR